MKGPVKTILVVDDEPDAIELVEFNLCVVNMVIAAEDGRKPSAAVKGCLIGRY